MWNLKKSVNLTLFINYLFMLALAVLTFTMPYIATWYVETMHRSEQLPTFIMVTYYPCVPFCAIALWSLRNFLKNIRNGKVFVDENRRHIRVVSICCMIVALICFVGGFYYNPFYIVSAAAAFYFLNARIVGNTIETTIVNSNEQEEIKEKEQ